ncbi:hypothetical protein [Nocardia mikamii]|uniref:hypothetical protein n=1 Tax=Nocardia mikamii TaxID=508464 RepID=UPI001FE17D75|nr:hypothetical protein [Nocardia mikamii]
MKGNPLLSKSSSRRRLIARIAVAGAVVAAPVAAVAVPAFADTPSAAPVDWHDTDHDHDGWRHHHDHDHGPWQPGPGGFLPGGPDGFLPGGPGGFLPGPPPTGSFG